MADEPDGRSSFDLPAGTVTFLLSDIEGSTRLWSEFPDEMGSAVAITYAILDRAIAGHDGVRPVEQGEGDSMVAAFSRASDAVAAALEAQLELHSRTWPEGMRLRVRIALHTADAQLRDDGNYFGLALSRCARLRAIALGGQTVMSRATRDLVVDRLPDGVDLIDCGLHRLRDLGRPEHVFALAHPDFRDEAPPLLSLDAFLNNLPDQLTSFVGRAREQAQLRDALVETRLLTLTGAGGAGKTRLALQVAADALERFPEGAWWVDLAPVSDPTLVSEVLASALGVHPLPTMTALQASCSHLAAARALVVLDNCEHLLAASAEVTEGLLRACPDVSVIATSRTPLGVAGETDWRVPSLSLPAPEREREPLESLRQSDAVALFIERARKARPNFAVTNENAPAVAQICHELDGLPLAIELAAARVRMLSAQQIADGLGDRFHLLTGGTRTALPRHQTLRASVDWSHELLSEQERTLLRRLSVFAGGFTLELAEATCADESLVRSAILDVLASLVDKSLVVAEERTAVVRYRLLETVRQYSLERLVEAGEASIMRDRHRDALLEFAERIAQELHGPLQREWLPVLDREAANLAAALDRAADTNGELALRMCVALTFWWKLRGLFFPAERGFVRALDAADPTPSSVRAQALWGRGYLAAWAGRIDVAMDVLQQARAQADAVEDRSTLGRALMMIGWIEMYADPAGSREINELALRLARESGDDWNLIASTINLAYALIFRYHLDEAQALLDEILPLSEQHGYLEMQAWHWLCKSLKASGAADAEHVIEFSGRALAAARAYGEPSSEALAHGQLASLELARGDARAAAERLEATRARLVATGAGLMLAVTVYLLAPAQAALGDVAGARAALEELVATGMDNGFILAATAINLADVLRIAGETSLAEERAAQALATSEKIGHSIMIASAKETLGRLAAARADWGAAEALLHEALAARIENDYLLHLPQTFDALAEVAAGRGGHEEAARILGAAERARGDLGLVRWAPDAPRFEELERTLARALGDDAYQAARAEGREHSRDDAVTWIRRARAEREA